MDIDSKYPAISDLRDRARRRIPHFVWEYLDSATGQESTMHRNRAALEAVLLNPAVLRGEVKADLTTQFLGQEYAAPFGVAPVGMSGLMWPDAERLLAETATKNGIPYSISTVATRSPEEIAPYIGRNGWFQLYPPRDPEIRADMLARIKGAGFDTMVLTVDVPVASRRERQLRGGLRQPPTLTPRLLAQVARCPAWAIGTMKTGMPKMRFLEPYANHKGTLSSTAHIGYLLRTAPDWDYVDTIRAEWGGKLLVKGVMLPEDAAKLKAAGADGVWISNHAGRQFDAAPAALDCVAPIRAAVGPDYPLIYDSSVEGGLDILRAIALGADFVMLGRAFHYGLGALGARGAEHVVSILRNDMVANMGQMGIATPTEVRNHLREKIRA
jgi:L-lactate dehydrogenase (cytochrome)